MIPKCKIAGCPRQAKKDRGGKCAVHNAKTYCTFDDCERPAPYGGLCEMHMQRKRRGGPLWRWWD